MSSFTKTNISISKKDLTKSRVTPVASRNIAFYHKATLGQLTINLLSLTMPSEMPTNVQATAAEISGAQLYNNRKNLDLVSSSKGPLIQGLDYIVSSGTTIALIGVGYTSGAELDEIFAATINAAPISDLVVASAKSVVKTYSLAVGQNILNLGLEYQTGVNSSEQIGIIKIWVNGVLAIRGEDYAEVDAGSGFGTTVNFYAAPATIPYQIVVDFGVMSITDNNAIGTIQSLSSSVLAIANDLAIVAGSQASDYYSASPSDIERRGFGDRVLSNSQSIIDLNNSVVSLTNSVAILAAVQTWQNVTAERSFSTTYTNLTNKPISIMVTGTSSSVNAVTTTTGIVDGLSLVASRAVVNQSGIRDAYTFIVPAGAEYSVTASITAGTYNLHQWFELR